MLSVILYGRNDNYGYNLHKRAALSLNCIAEILDDPDDEILFVDYNTPNDLPTFPEAIQDTLTARARERLRILRVRPEVHERFRHKTHLVALEPVSRNVALRHSNPANRWILSTNTDMIFVPRRTAPLSRVLASLPDGLYHLPRFEIPETLWETFDRRDGAGVIDAVRGWARDARLNEVVYGHEAILYDGPGDFQLAPRETYFGIDAFDERMLLGWHVDSNMAKRLAMVLGPPRSFLDHMFGYHCDHTRMATPAHRRNRLQNDPLRFFDLLDQADVPEQRDVWGCPDASIEDIRIPAEEETEYARMLKRRVPPLEEPYTEAAYTAESYDSFWYDPGHVLPFVADLFVAAPRTWSVAWFGCRPSMLARFAQAWQDLGFEGSILLSEHCRYLVGEPPPGVVIADDATIRATAQAYLFEAGLVAHDRLSAPPQATAAATTDEDIGRFQVVRSRFLDLVAAERARLTADEVAPKRFVFINAIHNRFEELVTKTINITLTPYSSRTRHGYVYLEASGARPVPPDRATYTIDGVKLPGSSAQIRHLADLARLVLTTPPNQPFQLGRAAGEAEQLLQFLAYEPAGRMIGASAEQVEELRLALEAGRTSAVAHPVAPVRFEPSVPSPEARGLTRTAEYHDWDSASWLGALETLADLMDPELSYKRSAWLWEKAQIVYGLRRRGLTGEPRTGLAACFRPDRVVGPLSEETGRLDLLPLARADDVSAPRSGGGVAPWADGWHLVPSRVRVLDEPLERLPADTYDYVVFPHSAIRCRGVIGFVRFLEQAGRVLHLDGCLVFSADVPLGLLQAEAAVEQWYAPVSEAFWTRIEEEFGLELESPFDPAVSRATADRAWESETPIQGANYFVGRDPDGPLSVRATWFLVKRRVVEVKDTRALRDIVREELPEFQPFEIRYVACPLPGGRELHLAPWEVETLSGLAEAALEAPDGSVPLRRAALWAEPVLGLLALPNAPELTGLAEADVPRLRERIEGARASRGAALQAPLHLLDAVPPAGERGLTRVAEYADWDDPDWLSWGEVLVDSLNPEVWHARSGWTWERGHVLYGLARLDLLDGSRRALVFANEPDQVIGALGEFFAEVDVASVRPSEAALTARAWADDWTAGLASVHPVEDGAALEPDYDAVIFPHGALLTAGPSGLARRLAEAAALVRPGGVVVFTAPVPLDGGPSSLLRLTADDEGFWAELLPALALELEQPFDGAVTPPTLDLAWMGELPERGLNLFVDQGPTGSPVLPSAWLLVRRDADDAPDAARAARIGQASVLGERLLRMHLGAGARRTEGGIAGQAGGPGHVAFGPYDRLDPGRYRVRFALADLSPTESGFGAPFEVVVEAGVGAAIFAQERLTVTTRTLEAALVFDLPAGLREAANRVEYRLWSNGRGSLRLENVTVEAAPDAGAPAIASGAAANGPPAPGERLPALTLGSGSERAGGGITVAAGRAGHAVSGPYDRLEPGRHRVRFTLADIAPARGGEPLEIVAEVVMGPAFLAQEHFVLERPARTLEAVLPFEVPEEASEVEYRLWSNGRGSFRLRSVRVEE